MLRPHAEPHSYECITIPELQNHTAMNVQWNSIPHLPITCSKWRLWRTRNINQCAPAALDATQRILYQISQHLIFLSVLLGHNDASFLQHGIVTTHGCTTSIEISGPAFIVLRLYKTQCQQQGILTVHSPQLVQELKHCRKRVL